MDVTERISDGTHSQHHAGGREGIEVVVHQGKPGEGTGDGAYGETLVHQSEVLHILKLLLDNLSKIPIPVLPSFCYV